MRRGAAALALVLAAAELRAQRPVQFDEREWAQNIRVLTIEDGRAPTPAELAYLVNAALGRDISAPSEVPDHRVFAIRALGRLGRSDVIQPLLALARDFDPPVAEAAGRVYERLSGRTLKVEPQLVPRPLPPTAGELLENAIARVTLDSGRVFYLRFFTRDTPLTYTRFVRLVRNRYYDGLPFHRVIPNRMVQGGSPGGNDEVGDGPFMRDELTTMRHERGTVGLMTRKRDQGAGQFFVNLVDNPAFDLEYTVFARVCDDGMDIVDRILEGTKMTRVELAPPTRTCRSDR